MYFDYMGLIVSPLYSKLSQWAVHLAFLFIKLSPVNGVSIYLSLSLVNFISGERMAMMQANLGFLKSPTFPFPSSNLYPKLSVKSTSLCLGFSCRPSGKSLIGFLFCVCFRPKQKWSFLIVFECCFSSKNGFFEKG